MPKRPLFVWGKKIKGVTFLFGALKDVSSEEYQSAYYQPPRSSGAGPIAFSFFVIGLYLAAKYFGWID